MIIDYHIHLELDEYVGRCPYNSENIERYVDAAEKAGIIEIGITEHCNRFREFLPVLDPVIDKADSIEPVSRWIKDGAIESIKRYNTFLNEMKERGYPIKVSIEVDYIPGMEETIRKVLKSYKWDYLLGSVHFIGGWALDSSPDSGWPERSVDKVYDDYRNILLNAIRSGIFDTIAHPDLPKKFGHRPDMNLSGIYEEIALALKEADMAYEINSAGLFKPVGEAYPAREFIEACGRYEVPAVISSDAHMPSEVGRGFDKVITLLKECGYRDLAVFNNRKRSTVPIG